jgi:hypothetical protein
MVSTSCKMRATAASLTSPLHRRRTNAQTSVTALWISGLHLQRVEMMIDQVSRRSSRQGASRCLKNEDKDANRTVRVSADSERERDARSTSRIGAAWWWWSARGPRHQGDAVTCPCQRRGAVNGGIGAGARARRGRRRQPKHVSTAASTWSL